jgi:anti-anti-sigma factor
VKQFAPLRTAVPAGGGERTRLWFGAQSELAVTAQMTQTLHRTTVRVTPEPAFQVNVTQIADDVVVIKIIGALDGYTARQLDMAMAPLIAALPASLVVFVRVELSALTFLDTGGLDSLNATIAALEAVGAQVDLVGFSRKVQWLFQFAAQHCWLAAGPILAAAYT